MDKVLKVIEKDSGEVVEQIEFSGGYNIAFTNRTDNGQIRHIHRLNNAKFGDKHWIKNLLYRPIADKLVEKFKELQHIIPSKILFIENMEWEPGPSTKQPWISRIKKAPAELREMAGYEYVLETRSYYLEQMGKEQVIARIYHELRHIDTDGSILKHSIEDWSNMVFALGPDWAYTKSRIQNILDEGFDWQISNTFRRQMNLFTNELKKAAGGDS